MFSSRISGRFAALIAGLFILITPSTSDAQTNWTGVNSTDWFDAGNWSAGVPGIATATAIDTTAPNSSIVDGAAGSSNSLAVGLVAAGALNIQNGGAVSSGVGIIGANVGATGTVTVTGPRSTWTNTTNLTIGSSGTGALNILDGGAVSNADGRVAVLVGSIGTVTVTGPGSTWTNSHDLLLGSLGSGMLSIQNGGAVSNEDAFVGAFAGSTGSVTVTGPGSTWTNTASLNVGSFGSGTLTVQSGGSVSDVDGLIGALVGSTGTATVTGPGSIWTNTANFIVGAFGTGTLNIQNGGAVSSDNSTIGANAGAIGTVTVTGSGSSWTNTAILSVGGSGIGALTIQNGGAVSGGNSIIGANAGATGTATVTGPGTTWTNTANLVIGSTGTGTLNIQNGGTVSNADSRVGVLGGSTGTVTVTGPGSTWTNSRDLLLGSLGSGMLTIQNGGAVSNEDAFVGAFAGSTGSATVTGPGSTWTNTASLNVGSFGSGTLTVQNGGSVSDVDGLIGALVGSTGTATVTGPGSTWASTASLRVGDSGAGTLSIQNGGVVSATNVDVARVAGSTGTLNIGAAAGAAAVAPGTLTTPTLAFGAGAGHIVFNHTSTSYTFAPDISGPGTVLVLSGTTNLTGADTYTGSTTVDGGALLVNGSIAQSPLTTVNVGGMLGGTGTVGNTMISGGTLAPGNSIGTLNVQGNLAFTAASTYMIEVGPTTSDRTNVAGTATLGGALVSVRGSGVSNQRYTIVNATGGVIGTFGAVNASNFNATLSYDANNAYMNLEAALGLGTTLNRNQQAVASSINQASRTGSVLPAGFQNLFNLTGANLAAALSQLSGEAATGMQQAAFKTMDSFLTTMSDPFMRDMGGPQSGATGYADGTTAHSFVRESGKPSNRGAFAAFEAASRGVDAQPWSMWAAGYGGSQITDGNVAVGSNGNTGRIYGGAAGFDYRFSPNTVAGLSLGGAGSNFNLANGLGGGRSEIFQAGAYGRHSLGAAYLAGALAYGWHDVTTDRTALSNHLHANFDANSISGRLEGGYRAATGMVGLTPYAAGQFTTLFLPNYAEQAVVGVNTFALAYAGRDISAPRSELGLRTDASFATWNAIVTLRGRAGWAHNFSTDRVAAAAFQTLPAASFVVNGAAQAREAALLAVSAETRWANGFSVAATFDGEFSRGTESYIGKGLLRYQW